MAEGIIIEVKSDKKYVIDTLLCYIWYVRNQINEKEMKTSLCEFFEVDDVKKSAKFLHHEASTLSLSLPKFSEDVDKNKMWDEFLSICRLIFETKVEDKFPCFLADDLWKVTNCDNRFEKLSAEQVRLQKSVIQNSPGVLEFLKEHGNILSDVQKKVNSIVCSDVCADGDSDVETSVAKNLSDIAEEGNNDDGNFITVRRKKRRNILLSTNTSPCCHAISKTTVEPHRPTQYKISASKRRDDKIKLDETHPSTSFRLCVDEKYAEIVERSSSWPDYVQVRNWVFNNNSKRGSTRNADVNVRTCSDVKR
ncbi:hypothetical protein HELRODRAFT_174492 [Helobdella robusta]|uniref:Uncharacterized protein n=1 Tax=Helobdella robusta TaxID=6412 RepID=T1F867_HELRO|nr:hypothetical protein HELRODRAFT_174492 [Helobdella robusta]ESO01535.1 hypothetical protein HELRODRAFT_174492 [Helobdella robusta]